jgi:hypothetical protein
LALNGSEWSVSLFGKFASEERVPVTHWIGGWAVSRSGLNVVAKRKIL